MNEIFVDSGAWLALADRRDKFHAVAVDSYPRLLRQPIRLVTSNLVVAESYNLISRRLGHEPGIRFLKSLRGSSRLLRVYADDSVTIEAETVLAQYEDQDFSLVDAVSFTLMRQRGIEQVFAFDYHFQVMGYTLLPTL